MKLFWLVSDAASCFRPLIMDGFSRLSISTAPPPLPMISSLPPKTARVLIVGGGPAGSYAASVLAREGISVTVFESDKFPRYHVGESLIPSCRHYMRFIGADDKLSSHGFVHKPGSAIKFNQEKREGYTDFEALGTENAAFNVVRSEFDHMLMSHARASGAAVYEQTKVKTVDFSSTDPNRPVSVTWEHVPPPEPLSPPASPVVTKTNLTESPIAKKITGVTSFDYLIDATGRAGLLSTLYLKNRRFNSSLKNIALWAYWNDVGTYGNGTAREGAPWFEALTDESGWAWFIPLHTGVTSVGVVMNQQLYHEKIQNQTLTSPFGTAAVPDPSSALTQRYISSLSLAPGVVKLITASGVMQGTIDPFFSSGVHLAMTSGLSAAATICASLRGDCTEVVAADWHTKRVSTSYTRFQVVVLSAYKQIRAQTDGVLCDVDEDNFDRAFAYLRPVIQGASDMGKRLSENELQKSLDFCVKLFGSTTPEDHARVAAQPHVTQELLDVTGPYVDPLVIENALHDHNPVKSTPPPVRRALTKRDRSASEVAETKLVLDKINARRVIHSEYAINNFESEPIAGYVARLEKGRLGLTSTEPPFAD
ncbi:hypothetical protein MIND_00034500 [Mycena indigotica]|uniref:FAD/NAD(P)-binding domain-containing protein n=1 Tax=Mycena indigotica TaxID=2126181 RepID=A0A8H6TD21_9AGAR|nr:uncharacterized protein MIND_00034500 [Mycena indigotica]KAF7315201.1 hypothetical protein MIND_00034500 [Mycena indigotica]